MNFSRLSDSEPLKMIVLVGVLVAISCALEGCAMDGSGRVSFGCFVDIEEDSELEGPRGSASGNLREKESPIFRGFPGW